MINRSNTLDIIRCTRGLGAPIAPVARPRLAAAAPFSRSWRWMPRLRLCESFMFIFGGKFYFCCLGRARSPSEPLVNEFGRLGDPSLPRSKMIYLLPSNSCLPYAVSGIKVGITTPLIDGASPRIWPTCNSQLRAPNSYMAPTRVLLFDGTRNTGLFPL
mgnify:CR=1 FL=1